MSILANEKIWDEMCNPLDPLDPLIITPLLDISQIGPASLDVRLSPEFVIPLESSVSHLDPAMPEEDWEKTQRRAYETVRVPLHRKFILHPGQLILGATLEYVSVPRTISASVEGKSSWGRLGLIIATA